MWTMRCAPRSEWDLTHMNDQVRAARLSQSDSPSNLLQTIAQEAERAANAARCILRWEASVDAPECSRVWATVPIGAVTFDAFFNGPAGYRAQYYLSVPEGIYFGLQLTKVVEPAIRIAHRVNAFVTPLELLLRSLLSPLSKAWIGEGAAAFDQAARGELRPRRWVETVGDLSRIQFRAPLPAMPLLDIKGAWIDRTTAEWWVHPDKADRDCYLHARGNA